MEQNAKSFISNIVRMSPGNLETLELELFREYASLNPEALLNTLADDISNSHLKNLRILKVIFGAVVEADGGDTQINRSIIEKLSFIPVLNIY